MADEKMMDSKYEYDVMVLGKSLLESSELDLKVTIQDSQIAGLGTNVKTFEGLGQLGFALQLVLMSQTPDCDKRILEFIPKDETQLRLALAKFASQYNMGLTMSDLNLDQMFSRFSAISKFSTSILEPKAVPSGLPVK